MQLNINAVENLVSLLDGFFPLLEYRYVGMVDTLVLTAEELTSENLEEIVQKRRKGLAGAEFHAFIPENEVR